MAEATVGLLRVVLESNSAKFTTEMGGASKAVTSFETTAKNAGRSLANMVASFDGSKALTEANKVVTAVNQVGGASKLTENELNKVRSTLDATIAKFNALGREVPADILKVRNEIAQLDAAAAKTAAPTGGIGQWSGALSMVTRLLPGLSVAGAVAGITSLATSALQAADKFVTFSERTGASIETVQRWQFVADQTGTSIEAFSNNAFKLGVNVSAGTDKVRAAIGQLGIAYDTLKAQKPEDQFAVVVRALEGVESTTERNRLGMILFGRQFSEIAVAVSEGYTRIADQATVASDAQVRAAEAAGDAWERAKAKIAAVALGAVGSVAQELMDVAASVDSLTEAEYRAFVAAQRLGEGHLYLVNLQRERMRGQHDINLATEEGAKSESNYSQQLAAAAAELKTLNAEQKKQLDDALKLGVATDELEEKFGLSAAAIRIYQQNQRDATKATAEFQREAEKAAHALENFWKQADKLGKDSLPNLTMQMGKWDFEARDHFTLVDMTAAGYAKATAEALKWAHAAGAVLAPSIKQVTPASLMAEEATEGFFTRVFGSAEQFGQNISSIFMSAFTGGGGALGAVKSFATQGLSALLGMIPGVGGFVSAFAGPIVAMISKLTKKFTDFFRKIFGGPSADEMAGRSVVDEFEDSLHDSLTAAQAAEAGTDEWKKTVIALRDAYIAAGRTEEEALADAKRLWESSKQGAEEAARVIEEIQRKMRGLTSEEHVIDVRVNYESGTPPNPGAPVNNTQPVPPPGAGVSSILSAPGIAGMASRIQAGAAAAASSMGATASSINILPMMFAQQLSPRQIGQQAAAYLATSGLPRDESGITEAFENVIGNYMRTYGHAG